MSLNVNDLILAEGDEARKLAEEKKKKKTSYVKLKDGEQLRGFLLTTHFMMYMRHGDYNKGIKSHTCLDPKNGKNCLSCQHGTKRVKATLVPFYNVDTNQIEVFDASNKAMKVINSYKDEYEEEATTTPIALKRSGEDTSTTYSLMPIRVKPAEKDLFVLPEDVKIDNEFYLSALNPPDEDYIREILGLTAAPAESHGDSPVVELDKPTDISDDDLPF
ncbi:hypothetical protein HB667_26590 [Bacillus cereus]|uniref:hypothetical protein n=1 Tax=Bacillus cereus group TaxID=86661 RepID=UPI001443E746|nr:hypothetical protein [Bacillus cereus]NKW77382.1 hypothetical protein [Bacillus cereus]NKX14799.1 hypothetical protein [Bacillus cereus]HDR8003383.1 hypothetical protein [Bacillus cereus]HDR8014929.1 hypothetical protein [Bacillus cereus]